MNPKISQIIQKIDAYKVKKTWLSKEECMINKYIRLQVGFYPRQSKTQQGGEGRLSEQLG